MNIVDTLLNIALLGSSWVLWLLLSLSVASIGLMIERLIFFWRKGRAGGAALREKLRLVLEKNDIMAAEKLLRDSRTMDRQLDASDLAGQSRLRWRWYSRHPPGGGWWGRGASAPKLRRCYWNCRHQ